MEVNSSPEKRGRADKAKNELTGQQSASTETSKEKKKKSAPVSEIQVPQVQPFDASSAPLPVPAENNIDEQIAREAYYLAEQRNFEPGRELDDWLEAERRVRAGRSHGESSRTS